jgi:hypothetical protein
MMTPLAHPGSNNCHRADTDDIINPDNHNECMLSAQTIMSLKLVMLPHIPKSNDARRVLNGIMCENKKARRLKLGWILPRCKKFMCEQIEDIICGRAFEFGLCEGGVSWFLVMLTGIILTCD